MLAQKAPEPVARILLNVRGSQITPLKHPAGSFFRVGTGLTFLLLN